MALSKPAPGPLEELLGPAPLGLLWLVSGGAAQRLAAAGAPLAELAADAAEACGAGQERLQRLAAELAGDAAEGCAAVLGRPAGGPVLSVLLQRGRPEAPAKRALRAAAGGEDGEDTSELTWLAAPLLLSALAVPCGALAPDLALAGLSVPMKLMFVVTSGILGCMTMQVLSRPAGGNDRVRWAAALSMGTSCAFHGAMALAGPFVVPLPEGCFAHPCLVWPILQDILVVPLQLTALWSKTQSDLRSMAPAAAWATVKTAGAIVMMTVPAYQVYGLGASFAGLVMLSKELCNLDVSASPQAVQDRVMGTGDLLIMGWGTIFLVESLVLTGIAPDETILRIFAVLDLLSKFGPGHLLTK